MICLTDLNELYCIIFNSRLTLLFLKIISPTAAIKFNIKVNKDLGDNMKIVKRNKNMLL